MHIFILIKPSTGEMMTETRYEGLQPFHPSAENAPAPKSLTSMHVAENHQSAMNCSHGGGWEVATVDLLKGIVAISETVPVD